MNINRILAFAAGGLTGVGLFQLLRFFFGDLATWFLVVGAGAAWLCVEIKKRSARKKNQIAEGKFY